MLIPLIEYARAHGIDPGNACRKAANGGFATARKIGRDWVIDSEEQLVDRRYKTGKYVGWREKAANRDNRHDDD